MVNKVELIKPASPTPDHLRTVQLSVLDNFFQPVYVAAIFFYNVNFEHTSPHENISQKLKKSLSEALTRFYPLAGRIEGASINCNDKGAAFTEVHADFSISDFMRNVDLPSLKQFLPTDFITSGEPPALWPLLHIKVSFFKYGGMAVGVCVSHKTCDAASLITFMRGWTTITRGYGEAVTPEFTAANFYPAADTFFEIPSKGELLEDKPACIMKRFVFNASKILELKYKVASESVPNPTRVEAITALLWKCATKASRSNSTTSRPTTLTQAMDLRLRTPHLSQKTFGNIIFMFPLKEGPQSEMEIHKLVSGVRKGKEEINDMTKENIHSKGSAAMLGEKLATSMVNLFSEMTAEMDLYQVSSWCKMPFYEADFGWGSPIWVTSDTVSLIKNAVYVILMDAKDNEGIEAWVTLPERDMPVFEQDQELLAFATPNPSVLI